MRNMQDNIIFMNSSKKLKFYGLSEKGHLPSKPLKPNQDRFFIYTWAEVLWRVHKIG